ncbi:helix-turn-helix domain-containing protein [Streptacidiphilus sp. 4-A2]|nr:helix-turn-helix domain-containing protein [Streptacidiphilus sp. 4-A2]
MASTGLLHVWSGLNRAHHAISDTVDRTLTKGHGLSISWFEVLDLLARQARPTRVSDIADQVSLSASRTCRVLHTLEERGVVTRTSSARDARSTEVQLTDAGVRLHTEALASVQQALAGTVLAELSAEEVAGLLALQGRTGLPAAEPAA